jgi:hypothetical protein
VRHRFVSCQHKFTPCLIVFQIHYRQVTGENLVLPLKWRCLTVVLLTLSVSNISILASYGFVILVNNIPDEILYSYLVSLMNLSGLYWFFTFTALSRSADALEESLSKVRKVDVRARIPLRAWMFGVCVCTGREALRRADHPPKGSYRMSKI